MIVRRVCAWCKTTMGLIASADMAKDTHGACRACADGWRVQLMLVKEKKAEVA